MTHTRKTWLITGISSGLGQALAQAVMNAGDFVIGTFRKQDQVSAFNTRYTGKGFAFLLDISRSAEIEKTVELISARFDRIDVLINNAGIGFVGAVEEASIAEVRQVFETNVFGTLYLTQQVLPLFRRQKNGHIIQISSHSGFKGFAGFGIYNASKFALEGFSEALAAELVPLGIKLTIVEPGPFRTEFAGRSLQEAAHTINDYTTTAGVFRKRMKEAVHGSQEGDPMKAAQVILQIAGADNAPLRLPLGKIAVATIGAKLQQVQNDLDAWRSVAESVVYA